MGASGYEERALKLLKDWSYNYDLAKLHMLYPTLVILHEDKIKKMSNQEIKDIVESAIQGLSVVKQEEQAKVIENLDRMFEWTDIEPIDITVVSNLLDRNNMELPKRFYEYRNEAKTFSKIIAKKLKQKLTWEELASLFFESKHLKIHTPEIWKLKELVAASQEWIKEAKSTIEEEVDLSKLNKLLSDAKKINVDLS